MAVKAAILRAHSLLPRTPTSASSLRCISNFPFLSQEPQLEESPPPPVDAATTAPLPPKPSSTSSFYQDGWRSTNTTHGVSHIIGGQQALVPVDSAAHVQMLAFSQTLDVASLMNLFADWVTSQRWKDIKQLFEFWIRSLDASGKPNKPDVPLFNYYLRANLMMGATAGELLDLVAQMHNFLIAPDTASYNLVLKAMFQAREVEAAVKLIDRMLQTGTSPDNDSYNLVISLLILTERYDSATEPLLSALKYMDLALKSGYMISSTVFIDFVRSCISLGKLDILASIIEKCKTTEQNKSLCPSWSLCKSIADVALIADHSKLAYFSLEFFARWMVRGENARPPVLLSVDEGIVVAALGTAGRTFNSTLLDASWSVLNHSLRKKRAPNPETYLAKINAHASLGQLQRAFSTLNDFETVYGNSNDVNQELFSPFTSLHPLVVACCRNGFSTLDTVYIQLENLSSAERPFKSVAALNCVILGCANIWDLDRAYETFEAISGEKMGLTPDIHSYNALMCAFGKLRKTDEATRVFDHLVSIGVKPNAATYKLLVDVHLVNRDPKAALAVIDKMIEAGFTPSKDTLKKLRRRCSREMDYDSDERVQALAQKCKCRMGSEARREMLYNLEYSTKY